MKRLFILTILLIFIGCDLILTPANEPLISLTSEKLTYTDRDEIVVRLKNESSEILFLNYCGGLLHTIERKEDEKWVWYSSPICIALFAPQWIPVLESGQSIPIDVRVVDPGYYRYNLLYKLSSEDAKERSLSLEFIVVH